ncbi:MAG: hypothetical protein H0S78_01205 [Tissierellales bacterium]|nr:hypothetical protein [Tissierellales bacterium]
MNKKIIYNTSEVVTCSGFKPKFGKEMNDIGIIENGAVVIEGKKIKAVGKETEIFDKYNKDEYVLIDAGGKTVMPGLAGAHPHSIKMHRHLYSMQTLYIYDRRYFHQL